MSRKARKDNRNSEPRVAQQRAAFDFLRDKYNTQELFTRQDFQKATGFSDVSFDTYTSKHFRDLLVKVNDDRLRVSLAFRQYATWSKFRDSVVTQNRILTRQYDRSSYENVVMFEFFMPLRNEASLHAALDGLFYKDSIKFRLKTINAVELKKQFPPHLIEDDEDYLERICAWIADRFVGYSINHVNGRFRVGVLQTRLEVLEREARTPDRYLVDETTASVRFIFPCKTQPQNVSSELNGYKEAVRQEASMIRWFFNELFVQSILEVVNGEDEIWLLESGMQNQLHIYKVED
jgi:hypothetical protein